MPSRLGLFFVLLFLAYALNFLYFFVDDEAIPFIYARNALRGRGLVYNSFEGRVEGYSDLLQVFVAAAILIVTKLTGLSRLAVFFVGKAISLAAGAATVWITGRAMRLLPGVTRSGGVVGLAFVALAGPLAMWSCSALEAASFGLLVTLLVFGLLSDSRAGDRLALGAAALALLDRIDGFVYAGAVLLAFLAVSRRERAVRLLARVVVPLAIVFVVYHAWRVWYFGELLSAPLDAKVVYKLRPRGAVVEKLPEANYAWRFAQTYGVWPAAVATVVMAWHGWKSAAGRGLLLAAVILVTYVSFVGDWMAGFRFFVPVLPILALLVALAMSGAARSRPRLGWGLAAACIVWVAVAAIRFATRYDDLEYHESWYLHPSRDVARYFPSYYPLYERSRRIMAPGDRTAYNQAGFLPFVLDLDNIDNLGICSTFFAELPTTDIVFTEVGRYGPLTDKPSLRAGDAYLLYREPTFVIERSDLLRPANGGHAPPEILWGRYRAVTTDGIDENVVYARTSETVEPFKTDGHRFLENLAHVSRLRSAYVNGTRVRRRDFTKALPFFYDGAVERRGNGAYELMVVFTERDLDVYELHINHIWSALPAVVRVGLTSATGRTAFDDGFDLAARQGRDYRQYFSSPVRASALALSVSGAPGAANRLRLSDVRVQGQTPELAAYINARLTFPAR